VSKLIPLAESLRDLAALIGSCAVAQGRSYVVRGNAVRVLEQRAGRVLEAARATGQPATLAQVEPDSPLQQALRQASRLRSGANSAFSGCIDVRLGASPSDLRELFEQAAREVAKGLTGPEHVPPPGPGKRRRPAAKSVQSKPSRTAAPAPRRVPKHVEMMGKATKLTELIRSEIEDCAGRTITRMCATVGVSRETFQNSKHFAAARANWERLRSLRQPQQGAGGDV